MNEDTTKDIGEKYETKPSLETVLEMLREMRQEMRQGFTIVGVRLDRVESLVNITRGEMLALRADFTEFKEELREHFPSLK